MIVHTLQTSNQLASEATVRNYFEFAAQTKYLLITFAATLILMFVIFPMVPIGGEMLDLKSGYSLNEAMAAMTSYGEEGRRVYAIASPTVDTLFPILYVTFFAGLIYRFRVTEGTWWLAIIPVISGIVDLCENMQITAMLIQYPNVGETQVAFASAFTTAKSWIGNVYQLLAIALLVIAFVRFCISKFQNRGSAD